MKKFKTFKDNDKVYYPSYSTKVYTLERRSYSPWMFTIKEDENIDAFFSDTGLIIGKENLPGLVHATEENRKILETVYNLDFEPVSLLNKKLSNGENVLCLVSKFPIIKFPKNIDNLNGTHTFIDIVISQNDEGYYKSLHKVNISWEYLYPIAIDQYGNITYLEEVC